MTGKIMEPPKSHPYKSQNGGLLNISFEYSDLIWPWSGYLAVFVSVSEEGRGFEGVAQGHISLTIGNPNINIFFNHSPQVAIRLFSNF